MILTGRVYILSVLNRIRESRMKYRKEVKIKLQTCYSYHKPIPYTYKPYDIPIQ